VFKKTDDNDMWTQKAGNITCSDRRIDRLSKCKHGSILFTTQSPKAAAKLTSKNIVSISEIVDATAKDCNDLAYFVRASSDARPISGKVSIVCVMH
jgi:hypothetical protein